MNSPLALGAGLIAAALQIYTLLVLLRILLGWFGGSALAGAGGLLGRLTDPYLNLFRGLFRRGGRGLDFSALAGLLLLNLLTGIFQDLALFGVLRIGRILALAVQLLLGALSWFAGAAALVALIRLVSLMLGASRNAFWDMVDRLIQPLVAGLARLLGRPVWNYRLGLSLVALAAGALWLGLNLAGTAAALALSSLPF